MMDKEDKKIQKEKNPLELLAEMMDRVEPTQENLAILRQLVREVITA